MLHVQIHGHVLLAVLLAAVAIWVSGTMGHLVRCHDKHCRCLLVQRWFSGRSLNGHTVWDSTFLREGRKVMTSTGHASPFQKLAGWERRAWRTLPPLAVAAWFISPPLFAAAAGGLAAVAGYRVLRRRTRAGRWLRRQLLRLRWHKGARVQPMAAAMATITGTAPGSVKPGIRWNPDYATAEPGGHVATWGEWPPGFKANGKEKAAVEDLWGSRVGFDLVFDWRTSAASPEVVMTRARELPSIAYLRDWVEKLEALPEHKTGIGPNDRDELECWDWATENPHGLLNAGSRHGKTETEIAMVAQVLRKGGKVTYVDVKRTSIQGLKGLPGLTLCDNPRDMPAMWLAIASWGKDLDDRIDERTEDPTKEFCRDLLVIEEVNQFSEMCDEFWETWPEEDEDYRGTILWKPKRAKRTPPIWRVVKHGVWEGAFAKKNVLIAGQNIEAQTVKGVRNSIGMRLLGGYQPQNWKALVGTTPIPAAPPVKGRWCLINGSTQTWVQALIADLDANASAAIWRDYARAGRRVDGTVPVAGPVTAPFTVTSNGTITAGQAADAACTPGPVTDGDPRGVLVSLAEAVAAGFAPGATVQALRMDRHRSDKGELPGGLKFPEPVREAVSGQAERFWSADLAGFNAARRNSRAA
jgi:hypothetical protein